MGWLHHAYGRLPYLGLWDQNFPGIVQLHSLVISIFGVSPFGFRLVDFLAQFATCILMAVILHRRYGKFVALAAPSLFALDYMIGSYWLSGQRDGFGSLAVLAATAIYLSLRSSPLKERKILSYIGMFAAGTFMAIAFDLRPTQIFLAIALAVAVIIYDKKYRWEWLLCYTLGGLTVIGSIVIQYAAQPGVLGEFWQDAIRFNTEVFTLPQYTFPWYRMLFFRPREIVYNLVVILWCVQYVRSKRVPVFHGFGNRLKNAPVESTLFLMYYIASKAGVIMMGKFFIGHYHPQLILNAILAALVLNYVIQLFNKYRVVKYIPALILAVLTVRIYALSQIPPITKNIINSREFRLDKIRVRNPYDVNDWEEEYGKTSDYLLRHDARGNRLEVWGWCPGLYWRTGCNSSSRFPFMLPLIMTGKHGEYTDFQRKWQREFMDSLTLAPPKFVVIAVDSFGINQFYYHTSYQLVDSVPGFRRLLDTGYTLDTSMSQWYIYKNKAF